MSKTYTFKSGYTISARDDYNPRLFDLTIEAFREGNPAPEPPIMVRHERIRGGTKEVEKKDWNNPSFIEAHRIWDQSIVNESHMMLLRMAADPDSIDKEMLAQAREWGEENGVPVPNDDLRAYLQLVAVKGEIADFFAWMNALAGPSEALVNQFLKVFREQSAIQGENGLGVGGSNPRRAIPRMAGTPQADDGQGGIGQQHESG